MGSVTDSETPQSAIPNPQSAIAWLRLTVEDNGPGIPPERQERIFDPFFTTKDRTRHAGLGLWICRSMVQDHGGKLWVESAVGQGTRVHLDLPVE